jgi:hypothetical protein
MSMADSFGTAERYDYLRHKRTELDALAKRIDELEARFRKVNTEAWIKAVSHFEGLKDQHAALQQRVEDAESAPPDDWANLKDGIEQAWAELEEAIEARAQHKAASR